MTNSKTDDRKSRTIRVPRRPESPSTKIVSIQPSIRKGNRIRSDGYDELIRYVLQTDPGDVFSEGPFASDDTFWRLTFLRLSLRAAVSAFKDETRRIWFSSLATNGELAWPGIKELPADWRVPFRAGPSAKSTLESCNALKRKDAAVLDLWRQRFEATEPTMDAPMMVRLKAEAGLVEEDLWVLGLLVAWVSDEEFIRWHSPMGNLNAGDIAKVVGLSPDQLAQLLRQTHPLQELSLIDLGDSSLTSTSISREFHLDPPVANALRGIPLDSEELSLIPPVLVKLLGTGPDLWPETASLGEGSLQNEPDPHSSEPTQSADERDHAENADPEDPPASGGMDETIHEVAPDAQEHESPPFQESVQPSGFRAKRTKSTAPTPYSSDQEFVLEKMEQLVARFEWKEAEAEAEDRSRSFGQQLSPKAEAREKKAKVDVLQGRVSARLSVTEEAGRELPQAIRWARQYGLSDFETDTIILVGAVEAYPEFQKKLSPNRYPPTDLTVGFLKRLLIDRREDQLAANQYFHKTATLLKEGFIQVQGEFRVLNDASVRIGLGVAEDLLGTENPVAEYLEGRYLFSSDVDKDNVIMDEDDKAFVFDQAGSYSVLRKNWQKYGMHNPVSYGNGLLIRLSGEPGTGKTMLAEAIAHHLGKSIQFANFERLNGEELRFLFRRALDNDAVLFFDDAEQALRSRKQGGQVSQLFTELERFEGICIIATNMPEVIDEAINGRSWVKVELKAPNQSQQEAIWRVHLPENIATENDLDFQKLSTDYSLRCGRDIRNAYLCAVSRAISRDSENPKLCQADLEEAARRQSDSRVQDAKLSKTKTPKRSLEEVILKEGEREKVERLIGCERARALVMEKWGFRREEDGFPNKAIFHGPPGTGKNLTSLAVAFELNKRVQEVNMAHLLSKWVSEGAKNIQELFRSTNGNHSILVVHEADALFSKRTEVNSSSDRYANLDISVLLGEVEMYPGVVILTTNLIENIDPGFARRFPVKVEFSKPSHEERVQLWKVLLPAELPLSPDVNLSELARREATGAEIRTAAMNAATYAALRPEDLRVVTMADLINGLEVATEPMTRATPVGFSR